MLKSRRAAKRPHGAVVRKCTNCTMESADMALPEKKNVNVFSYKFSVYNAIKKKRVHVKAGASEISGFFDSDCV